MKNMRVLISVVVFILLSFMLTIGDVGAFSFTTTYSGPVKIKYSNWESAIDEVGTPNGVVDNVGEGLMGIAKISTINAVNASNTLLWADGQGGEELTAVFSGYVASAIVPSASGYDVFFTDGGFKVYLDNTPDFNATIANASDGSLFLDTVAVPGIVPSSPTTTLFSSVSALTAPLSGTGTGYLDIVGGSFASMFAQDVYGINMDLLLKSDIEAPGNSGWPIISEDPVSGQIVPEPGTIVLLGAGLLVAGISSRRMMRK